MNVNRTAEYDDCVESAKKLISSGEDVNAQCEFGFTALHIAANHGFTEAAEILLQNGAAKSLSLTTHSYGSTPLHVAANNGSARCVLLFIQYGANINALNESGKKPSDVAMFKSLAAAIEGKVSWDVAIQEAEAYILAREQALDRESQFRSEFQGGFSIVDMGKIRSYDADSSDNSDLDEDIHVSPTPPGETYPFAQQRNSLKSSPFLLFKQKVESKKNSLVDEISETGSTLRRMFCCCIPGSSR